MSITTNAVRAERSPSCGHAYGDAGIRIAAGGSARDMASWRLSCAGGECGGNAGTVALVLGMGAGKQDLRRRGTLLCGGLQCTTHIYVWAI